LTAPSFHSVDGENRRHLLDAADMLLELLEEARHSRELQHMRGDLARLQDEIKHMRRMVGGQPGFSAFKT
jgi:hypothetical protein